MTFSSEFELLMANSYLNHYHQEERKVTFLTLPCWRGGCSNVPADFKADDPTTDPRVIEKATRLSVNVSEAPQPDRPSREATDEMEAAFRERVDYTADMHRAYKKTRKIIKALNYLGTAPVCDDPSSVRNRESLYCCLIAVVITT